MNTDGCAWSLDEVSCNICEYLLSEVAPNCG